MREREQKQLAEGEILIERYCSVYLTCYHFNYRLLLVEVD